MLKHFSLKFIFLTLGLCISNSACSGTIGEPPQKPYLIGLSLGPTFGSGNKTQTFYLQPDIQNSYVANHNNTAFISGDVFLAQQKKNWQLGLLLLGSGNATLSGDILEGADPSFNNADYEYQLSHAYIGLQARGVSNKAYQTLQPYVAGSIGIAFNHAHRFINTPKITEEPETPNFKNHTQTSFSYTLGLGLEKTITQALNASIGYAFSDWGQTALSRAPAQTLNQGLRLNHFYAQTILFSVFYLI